MAIRLKWSITTSCLISRVSPEFSGSGIEKIWGASKRRSRSLIQIPKNITRPPVPALIMILKTVAPLIFVGRGQPTSRWASASTLSSRSPRTLASFFGGWTTMAAPKSTPTLDRSLTVPWSLNQGGALGPQARLGRIWLLPRVDLQNPCAIFGDGRYRRIHR